ncbi:nif-specific transcriptional activator NifA [Bradyrhizobium sp. 83012]|uniref:Nif-specific regulatory protein n=1 Tax=Bradyrhizobium aeschynomenes TaxID=2734909 RepID=A0ABX2CND2_9BRAD|nr:nif-specific transcriptional activator NifA [Bradyrhizobium aeschynomenes]NPU15649.1 nif-specific transcriptional activator NifA [Bradyrhizobium aeschynomenes]NPU69706.1 nif-specific transcriptional activator NifA [Bradyrhizobium aeschynomenes]NPV24647.1 nif-specific transcriptional activator NifA [Bradyrhizobium aeschynomenes]
MNYEDSKDRRGAPEQAYERQELEHTIENNLGCSEAGPCVTQRACMPDDAESEQCLTRVAGILMTKSQLEEKLADAVKELRGARQFCRAEIYLRGSDKWATVRVIGGQEPDAPCHAGLYREASDLIAISGRTLARALQTSLASSSEESIAEIASAMSAEYVGVPIMLDGRAIGAVSVERDEKRECAVTAAADRKLIVEVADLISGAAAQYCQIDASGSQGSIPSPHDVSDSRGQVRDGDAIVGIVGESQVLKQLLRKIHIAAKSNSTVLLRGESGTGKERFAEAIHLLSPRASRPFIKVNCAALAESVLESELFGHEKGAFTGALSARKGRFELANKGTLFLDEIGEISQSFQAKLLRVLQEQEFERVGGGSTLKVDVRVIAATNKNLELAVSNDEFRADLYYRLNVIPLRVPPLRERPADIPLLAVEFLQRFNKENGRELTFDPTVLEALSRCEFPGNVRELDNCVRRTATFAKAAVIQKSDLACFDGQCLSAQLTNNCTRGAEVSSDRRSPKRPMVPTAAGVFASSEHKRTSGSGLAREQGADQALMAFAELRSRERLIEVMERVGWVQAKAARVLGLTPRQIGYALRKHGIEVKKF